MKGNVKNYMPTDEEIDEIVDAPRGRSWGQPVEDFSKYMNLPVDEVEYIEEDVKVVNQTQKAVKDLNLMNEGKMTNLEKDELKARIDGARPAERNLTIRRFTTDELYSEIGRRLKKGDNYLHDLKILIDRYYDEDEDLKDLEDS